MTTISITRSQLVSLASVAHCASTDDIVPIINSVKLSGDTSGKVVAVATDRHVIAELTVEEANVTEDFSFVISAKGFLDIAKALKGKAIEAKTNVVIQIDDSVSPRGIKFITTDSEIRAAEITGNYPPIEGLMSSAYDIQEELPGINLSPRLIANLAKVIPLGFTASQVKNTPFEFKFTMSRSEYRAAYDKPGPVIITRQGSDSFRALLQPANPKR